MVQTSAAISGTSSSHKIRPDPLATRVADVDVSPTPKVKPDRRGADIDLAQILTLPGRALLNEREAAAALHLSVRVLRDWRHRNIGPKYLKLNASAVRYKLADLWAYQDAQPVGGEGSGPRKARRKGRGGV